MRVKPFSFFAALAVVAIIGGAGVAQAQCSNGCAPPPPPSPPVHPGGPNMPGCGGGKCGGNVNVNVNVNVRANANAHAGPGSYNGSGSGAVYYGGGYGNWSQAQGIPSSMGLNVQGAEERGFESYEASRIVTREVLLQASCIDDKGVPHPASQVFGGRDVNGNYTGEVYRCIAGTRLQYIADGKSYDCAKNDALWHEGGRLECRRQKSARACNERSLLRKFGAGTKLLTLTTTESYMAQREIVKQSSASYSSNMVFDGGVGGFVQ
ncbi:hypothetical protein [Asticcacaulis tiandongensis]|uniref:hypothetical protein n=1 Tax=Asticcacaulis tiandongensis TaxID=2565365 RepID=UPI001125FA9C|nr:hypothetical protein [Asticcacaulis tiandongensis]